MCLQALHPAVGEARRDTILLSILVCWFLTDDDAGAAEDLDAGADEGREEARVPGRTEHVSVHKLPPRLLHRVVLHLPNKITWSVKDTRTRTDAFRRQDTQTYLLLIEIRPIHTRRNARSQQTRMRKSHCSHRTVHPHRNAPSNARCNMGQNGTWLSFFRVACTIARSVDEA